MRYSSEGSAMIWTSPWEKERGSLIVTTALSASRSQTWASFDHLDKTLSAAVKNGNLGP